jgi:branched-chain amino acid transport system ATP-binding protein
LELDREIPDETLLEINNLDVFHESFQALWDVSISIKKKEIVAIIGANGSGKSTLLDTISGLVHPAKGSIKFEGKDISRLRPFQIVDQGISQIPEGRRVFPDLTILENLIIGSFNRKARPKKEQNLQAVYQIFPTLKERKNQLAKTLSGGEQQMLAIGRGLMSDPKLLLLDEMSLGLAPILINELYKVLKQIRDRGITILFVEQNVRKSLMEADRAYVMEVGRIVLSGDTAKLREVDKVKKAYFGV